VEHDSLIPKPISNGTPRIITIPRTPPGQNESIYKERSHSGQVEVTEASGNMSSNYSIGSCPSGHQYTGTLVLPDLKNGEEEFPAVKVTNAVKCYGNKRILKSLNMTVKRGAV